MPATAGGWTRWHQEPKVPSRSPRWVQGPKCSDHFLLLSQPLLAESQIEARVAETWTGVHMGCCWFRYQLNLMSTLDIRKGAVLTLSAKTHNYPRNEWILPLLFYRWASKFVKSQVTEINVGWNKRGWLTFSSRQSIARTIIQNFPVLVTCQSAHSVHRQIHRAPNRWTDLGLCRNIPFRAEHSHCASPAGIQVCGVLWFTSLLLQKAYQVNCTAGSWSRQTGKQQPCLRLWCSRRMKIY